MRARRRAASAPRRCIFTAANGRRLKTAWTGCWIASDCSARTRALGPKPCCSSAVPQGLRGLQGFLQLAAKDTPANVAAASPLATAHGVWQLRALKHWLQAPPGQAQFQFVQAHPLIRDLSHYQALVPDCFPSQTENQLNS